MFRTTRKRSQTETEGGREGKNQETKKDNTDLAPKVVNNTPQKEIDDLSLDNEMRGEI